MIRVEESSTFPVSVSEAFDYITDLDNWPHYWPGFVRIEGRDHVQWGVPGGTVTVVIRLLGREVPLHITVQEFERGRIVRYLSQQSGLAEAYHERHFTSVAGLCLFRTVVAYTPRRIVLGLYDRILVKRAIRRTLRKTHGNLGAVCRETAVPHIGFIESDM